MSRPLVFLLLVLGVAVGVSVYQEWLVVSSDNVGNKHRFIFAVDTDKFHADVARMRGLAPEAKDQLPVPVEPRHEAPAPPPPPVP